MEKRDGINHRQSPTDLTSNLVLELVNPVPVRTVQQLDQHLVHRFVLFGEQFSCVNEIQHEINRFRRDALDLNHPRFLVARVSLNLKHGIKKQDSHLRK